MNKLLHHKTLLSRIMGFVSSIILTLVAFLLIVRPDFFYLDDKADIWIIFVLALLQAVAQSVFFLNLWSEKKPRWNLIFFASTIAMILVIIVGSMWIMGHLDCHMMCH